MPASSHMLEAALALFAVDGAYAMVFATPRAPIRATAPRMQSESNTATYYNDKCDDAGDDCEAPGDDEFTVAILGDLHLDPRKMEDYATGRSHFLPILEDAKSRGVPASLVSLGDLGESKSVRPDETDELFAGTTECHELAADFLGSFGVPYDVIGGNHDLEGIDEFSTDEANLETFNRVHKKDQMQFCTPVADKTLLVGLGSTVFRSAKYTSHEVTIDDEQLAWFEDLLCKHPADEGWKIFMFTHAPPIGSGLRVLQENHVVNGCCWLNHSGGKRGDAKTTTKFIELVREHRCIKAWFSGHFHLGQDYMDSITFPTIPKEEGPYPNRGSCVFAQTSVMRAGTSRDKRQQSRLLRGNKDGFEICTVDHFNGGTVRLDATITYKDTGHEVGVYAHGHEEIDSDAFMKVYSPVEGDECYVSYDDDGDGVAIDPTKGCSVDGETVAWWKMACGRVLGLYDGRLIEYDPSTLAPLGLVVGFDELEGKRVVVVGSGADGACAVDTGAPISEVVGMEGADCADFEPEEQAVLLVDDATSQVTVVQPNEDGSYWRKIVRNKMIRMKEKRRLKAGQAVAKELFPDLDKEALSGRVVSSYGPYTSIVGTAVKTGVAGITTEAELVAQAAWDAVSAPSEDARKQMGSELEAAFRAIDTDGDGAISKAELALAVKKVNPAATDADVNNMVALAGGAEDGEVTMKDFVMMMLFQPA